MRVFRGNGDAEELAEDEGEDRELREGVEQRPRQAGGTARIAVEELAARERKEEPRPARAEGRRGGTRAHARRILGEVALDPREDLRPGGEVGARHDANRGI